MMIRVFGEKKTPTEFAKEELLSRMGNAGFWQEGLLDEDLEAMTPKEIEKINELMAKHYERVQKFLGYSGYSLG